MASECVSPIRARVARLVKLDTCGVPVTGAASAVVTTKGFVQIQPASQYDVQGAIRVRSADGALCVNEPDQSDLTEVEVTIDFCLVDPDVIVIATGESLITGAGPVGTGVWFGEGIITARYSLEVWQPVAGAGACTPGGLQKFVYWAWPNLGNSRVGSFTIQNGELTFQIVSTTKAAATQWGDGPGTGTSWLPGVVPSAFEHWAFNVTTTAPPAIPAVCGAVPLT